MTNQPLTAHYIASTHWDREWYQPFQDYRMRLVQVMDGVLETLEADPRFAVFHADGQMIMIKDYLEIRPENRERIARLAQAGRLLLGPWYCLPDEMLVSGEALIRNLMVGHRAARAFGVEAMKFGYLCDMFGHISQMPQILCGFGIDAALLGRGTNEHTHPAHFVWKSPDGSKVVTYKLQDVGGYGAFTFAVRQHEHAPDLDRRIREYIESERARSDLGLIMFIDGLDHYPILTTAPELLERIRQVAPEVEVIHSSLPAYAAAMRQHMDELPTFRGELRDTARKLGGYLYLISNCLSSRYPLKQANCYVQTLLERWAEPYLIWANQRGARHLPTTYLDVAWDFLLHNHPHDSICGCSLDQVHKDMEYRFDQARLIGEGVVCRALQTLAPDQGVQLDEPRAFHVLLAQAEPQARREVVVFDIAFPPEWDARFHEGFIGEPKNSFRLYDPDGKEVPYQLLSVDRGRTLTHVRPDSLAAIVKRDVHRVAAEVDLPPLGYTTLEVRPAIGPVRIWGTLRHAQSAPGSLSMENEHLAVSVNPNGTLRLLDKVTGRTFDNLLIYADDGEVGDGWFHIAPVADELVTSLASPCEAGVLVDGPLMVTLRLRTRLQVPVAFDWQTHRRSAQRTDLVITSDVTLKKGERALFVQVTVDNNVKDHRLRVLFPTGVRADTWWVDQAFDLIEREIELDPACVDDKELPVPEKNMWAVAALVDKKAGLAFVSGGGLHEAAAHDDVERTLAITLLRSFARPVATDGQPGGQIQGQHTFTFALAPVSGAEELPDLLDLRDRLATGVRVYQTADGYGAAERRGSLLRVKGGGVRLSAFKPAADGRGYILRLYNPTEEDARARVRSGFDLATACLTNLNEENGEMVEFEGRKLDVEVPAKKIVTLRLTPA